MVCVGLVDLLVVMLISFVFWNENFVIIVMLIIVGSLLMNGVLLIVRFCRFDCGLFFMILKIIVRLMLIKRMMVMILMSVN